MELHEQVIKSQKLNNDIFSHPFSNQNVPSREICKQLWKLKRVTMET